MKRRFTVIATAVLMLFSVSACTEKAKVIQVAVEQYSDQSTSAIENIDALRRAETAVTPLSPAATTDKVVNLVLKSKKPIDRGRLRLILDPFRSKRVPGNQQWQAFIATLRSQHNEFRRIFARLDKGSFVAAPSVKKAIPPLDRLNGQLLAFAQSIQKKPAEFARERAGIAADMEGVRGSMKANDVKRLLIKNLYARLQEVEKSEQQATRDVLEHSAKALEIGRRLRTLLSAYDTLTVDDIMEGITLALDVGGRIVGRDVSSLKQNIKDQVGAIRADPDMDLVLTTAAKSLGELEAARPSK